MPCGLRLAGLPRLAFLLQRRRLQRPMLLAMPLSHALVSVGQPVILLRPDERLL
jgi:hypothetical protein